MPSPMGPQDLAALQQQVQNPAPEGPPDSVAAGGGVTEMISNINGQCPF